MLASLSLLLFVEMPQITQVSVITAKSSIKKLSQKFTVNYGNARVCEWQSD